MFPAGRRGQESDPTAEGLLPPLQVGKELAACLPALLGLRGIPPLRIFCSCVSLQFWLSQVCSFLLTKVSSSTLGERAEKKPAGHQASLAVCPDEA